MALESSSIVNFISRVKSDFARPNLFEVDLNFPSQAVKNAATLKELGKFTVRAANLPSSQVGVVEVPFRGRVLKIAGDRTFEPWTITVQNDVGFQLRTGFESWMESIQAYTENITQESDIEKYLQDMTVTQIGRTGKAAQGGNKSEAKALAKYKFYSIWPSSVSAIDLDFGNNDSIEEFTVELQVQYWEPQSTT